MTTEQWPYFAQPLTNLSDVLGRMFTRVMRETTYCGIPTLKNPTDAWVYEELMWKLWPDVVVEVGSYKGGHLLKMAHYCDMMEHGEVIGIDLDPITTKAVLAHPRITVLEGDATDLSPRVHELVAGRPTLVIEDSGHSDWNTISVLRHYCDLVHPGGYIVVEDTIGIEAMNAVDIFLAENHGFQPDYSMEEFGVSWNPKGYLRRI